MTTVWSASSCCGLILRASVMVRPPGGGGGESWSDGGYGIMFSGRRNRSEPPFFCGGVPSPASGGSGSSKEDGPSPNERVEAYPMSASRCTSSSRDMGGSAAREL
eukprot:6275476-Prymnesium_polylepis.1